jgi:putative nucleotidyltransferase with HDIG domain
MTMLVLALTDDNAKLRNLRQILSPAHAVHSLTSSEGHDIIANASAVVFDLEIRSVENIERVKNELRNLKKIKKRVFVVEKASHISIAQAFSLDATDVIFDADGLKELFKRRIGSKSKPGICASGRHGSISETALSSLFSSVFFGESVDLGDARRCADDVIDSIQAYGLTTWLDRVRAHHRGTFQHCLLVTGTAIDFAMALGFATEDVRRLGLAAALHDIGKAAIPTAILDKPGKLDQDERAVIEQHPSIGYDALTGLPGLEADVLGAVLHHHEFLDGSGYPDRLRGPQIPDLVRILTIADIFSALIELRSYKPPMPRQKAYDILCEMTGKLETPLVRAFSDVALRH